MKIRFLPPSPKAGTETHIDNVTGRTLCAAGLAECVPYRDFRERLAAEATSQSVGTFQNVNVSGEEWACDSSLTQFRQVVIIRKHGSETIVYDGPIKDTPPTIVQQFNDAVGKEITPQQAEWAAELRERERNKQITQEQKDRAATTAVVNARK